MHPARTTIGLAALAAILCLQAAPVALAQDIAPAPDSPAPTPSADALGNLRPHADAAVTKGLDWLRDCQRADGSWSATNFPAITALGLWAFTLSDHPDRAAVCSKAAGFVAGCVQEDGGIYRPATGGRGSGGLSIYNTAICMVALHTYNRQTYAPLILAARTFMAGGQLEGDSPAAGGFGYEQKQRPPPKNRDPITAPRGPRADLSNTAWAFQAMRVTEDVEDLRPDGQPAADLDWEAATRFLDRLRIESDDNPAESGGFGYEAGGERAGTSTSGEGAVTLRGFGSMTYAGLESMIFADLKPSDPRVRSTLAWAARHWSVDENPGMGARGLFYYYTILARALDLLDLDTLQAEGGSPIPWRRDLAAKLVSTQRKDGSWINSDGAFWENDPVLATSYALLSLQLAAHPE